jgi:hypothetical protein
MAKMRLMGLEFGQQAAGVLKFAQVTAQHRVDKSGLRTETALPRQLDRFVDRGMMRDAIEPEDLVQPKPQEILQRRFLDAALRFAGDEPIERCLPAHDAINQLLTEMAIGRRKARSGQRRFEQVLNESPPFPPLQNTQRYLSWFFAAHNL